MTLEALEKAKVLDQDLATLRSNLETWEIATKIRDQIQLAYYHKNRGQMSSLINNDFIDFDHLKLVTVARIKNMIAEKEKELEAL